MATEVKGILGRKIGMTQVFDESGRAVPVTVVEAGPCRVAQVKVPESDGYTAVRTGVQSTGPFATYSGETRCGCIGLTDGKNQPLVKTRAQTSSRSSTRYAKCELKPMLESLTGQRRSKTVGFKNTNRGSASLLDGRCGHSAEFSLCISLIIKLIIAAKHTR